jgi:hypothetical protein
LLMQDWADYLDELRRFSVGRAVRALHSRGTAS